MLPEVRRILYCTDLSETSVNAFRYAVLLAKHTGAQIHMLHVVGELSQDAKVTLKSYVQSAGSLDDMLRERPEHAKREISRRLDAFWDGAEDDELALRDQVASVDVRQGYPVEVILKKSKDAAADMIVISPGGKCGFVEACGRPPSPGEMQIVSSYD